jgi:hypothetical protein
MSWDDDDDWVGEPPEGRYGRDRAKPEFWRHRGRGQARGPRCCWSSSSSRWRSAEQPHPDLSIRLANCCFGRPAPARGPGHEGVPADDRLSRVAIVRATESGTIAFVAMRSLERRRPIRQSGRALAPISPAFRGEQSPRGRVLRRPVSGKAGTNGR